MYFQYFKTFFKINVNSVFSSYCFPSIKYEKGVKFVFNKSAIKIKPETYIIHNILLFFKKTTIIKKNVYLKIKNIKYKIIKMPFEPNWIKKRKIEN